MTPEQLQTATRPETVFAGCTDRATIDHRWRELAVEFHPDRNPRGGPVMANVNRLRTEALELLALGTWTGTTMKRTTVAGIQLSYYRERAGDLGREFVTTKKLVTDVTKNVSLAADALKIINNTHDFLAGDPKLAKEVNKHLPGTAVVKGNGGDLLLVVERNPATVALVDLIDHVGALAPEHVAWIIGSMYSFSCFMTEWKMVHCGLTPNNVFVDPQNHVVQVVGGWAFCSKTGAKLKTVPADVYSVARSSLEKKIAVTRVDLEMIKHCARFSLGDAGGTSYRVDVPKPMRRWLSLPAGHDSIREYAAWEKVRKESFGLQKFVVLGLSAEDVYQKGK